MTPIWGLNRCSVFGFSHSLKVFIDDVLADGEAFATYDVGVVPLAQSVELALLDDLERVALLASVQVAKIKALVFCQPFHLMHLMTYPLGKVGCLGQLFTLVPSYHARLNLLAYRLDVPLHLVRHSVKIRTQSLDFVLFHCILLYSWDR